MVVVKNDHTKRLLAEAAYGQDFIRVAPVAVVFCANMQRIAHYGERGEELYALQDVAAAVENMMLFLHGRGIGSVWVGAFDERKAAEAIGTPDHARPVAIVPMGYPAEKGAHRKRLALDEVVHWEKW
jgi:nitroreductase